MPKKRKVHSPEFKVKVAVDAIRGLKTASELASQYQIHPVQISQWRKQALEGLTEVFQRGQTNRKAKSEEEITAPLFEEIGRLKMELDWLKKKSAELCEG
jgi:transposase-like protein